MKIKHVLFFVAGCLSFIAACGLQGAVSEVQDAAQQAAKVERGRKGFDAAVTAVTIAATDAIGKAVSDATASSSAPRLRTQAEPLTVSLDTNNTGENGATLMAKGSIVVTTTDTGLNEQIDLALTWANAKLTVDGKEYTSTGQATMTGSLNITRTPYAVAGELAYKGTFTLDGESHSYNMVLKLTAMGMSWTGTVDGQPSSGSYDFPKKSDGANNNNTNNNDTSKPMACYNVDPGYEKCTHYTGSYWASDPEFSYSCGGTTNYPEQHLAACPAGHVNKCTTNTGGAMETVYYYYDDYTNLAAAQAGCGCTTCVWE